jgi:hypothetical protein
MFPIPLQVIDSFLLKLNVGDALIVAFVLGVFGLIPLKSRKLVALHTVSFGLLFLVLPTTMFSTGDLSLLSNVLQYKLVGLVLVVVSPMLFATADR